MKYIPENYRCNEINDCEDASDEAESLCSPPCSADMLSCADGLKCIPKSKLCDGYNSCKDDSHTIPSQCNNCNDDRLFKCKINGFDVCMNSEFKCDGAKHCDDSGDELLSECPNCVDVLSKFTCRVGGRMVCLSKEHYRWPL